MSQHIIGFTGKKGAGKDVSARVLVDQRGYKRVAFADPLREVLKIVFGITDEEMNDRVLKEKPLDRWPFMSPREIMQVVGTDLFRERFPGVWLHAFEREARKHAKIVVTDIRFNDEADIVRKMGGKIARIKRPTIDSVDGHRSETEQDGIRSDFEIINDGDFEYLETAVLNELGNL